MSQDNPYAPPPSDDPFVAAPRVPQASYGVPVAADPFAQETPLRKRVRPHRAGLIITLAVLSIVVCFPLGIVAAILGHHDLGKIDRDELDVTGRGATKAGMIIGIVGTFVGALNQLLTLVSLLGKT